MKIHEVRRRRAVASGVAFATAVATTRMTHALDAPVWPQRPVHLIVGFPGGSTPDLAARVLADPLAQALGQPVVVENRVGASGNLATDLIARARDDHTIGLVINGNLTSAKLLQPGLPYDPMRDFSYLALVASAPLVLVGQADAPRGRAFLDAARAAGKRWNYGSVGIGSLGHLGMELLASKLPGLAAQHVPYAGNPQIVAALIGRQIELALVAPGVAMPQVRAARIAGIGVTSGRSVLASELPSLSELGVVDVALEVWNGLVGPASLTPPARARLASVVPEILSRPAIRQQFFEQSWQAAASPTGDALAARVRDETRRLGAIIEARHIRID